MKTIEKNNSETKNISTPLHSQSTAELIAFNETLAFNKEDPAYVAVCPIEAIAMEQAGCLWHLIEEKTQQAWINTVRESLCADKLIEIN